jgi:putative flippase GtrA
MKIFTDFLTEDIKKHFTQDAWRVIIDYLQSLERRMDETNAPNNERKIIGDGVKSFIEDFIDDNTTERLITFSKGLGLIATLGSPNEIIPANFNDAPVIPKSDHPNIMSCDYCNYANQGEGQFCQRCGNSLFGITTGFSLKQNIIDSPYLWSFIIAYIGITFLLILSDIPDLSNNISFIDVLLLSLLRAIIPSIIISIFAGYILNQNYKEEQSFKKKYRRVAERYEEKAVFGFIGTFAILLPVMAILAGLIVANNLTVALIIGIIFVIILFATVVTFVLSMSHEIEPEEISYFDLLSHQNRFDEQVFQNTKDQLKHYSPYFLIISIIWIIILSFVAKEASLLIQIATMIALLIILFVGMGGIIFIRSYSSKEIIKSFYRIKEEKTLNN